MTTAYLHTFGCKVNQFDSQIIREHFAGQAYTFTTDPAAADVIIINSCTVTAEADRQCRALIRKLTGAYPSARVVLAGCYARRSGPALKDEFPTIELLDTPSLRGAAIASFAERSRAFVKIQDGCDAFCAYCIVPFVRPGLWSRPLPDVLSQVGALVRRGYPEVVLTGVHLGKYEGGLVPVIRELIALPGRFRLRLSSLEATEVTDDLLALMRGHPDRLCHHLHLPLQSGSDAVLTRMRRPYVSGDFLRTVERIRRHLPDCGISIDVIVGFPGETDEDFASTCACIERARCSRLHVFPYSLRPGTAAAGMTPTVPAPVIKERARRLRALGTELEARFWRGFAGTVRPAVLEGAKHTALTDNYIRVDIDDTKDLKYQGIFDILISDAHGRPRGSPVPAHHPAEAGA